MEAVRRPVVEWGKAVAVFPAETVSGDHGEVAICGSRSVVLAIDALGHGHEASRVADIARRVVLRWAQKLPLEEVFRRCHEKLRCTRGVAMSLATIDSDTDSATWLGVGNIQGAHMRLDGSGMPQFESMIMRGGVVGGRLPPLQATRLSLKPGDTIILATDGVAFDWFPTLRMQHSPAALAAAILEDHCVGDDDALVLALRYHGREPGQPLR